jgi:hypothetical protein
MTVLRIEAGTYCLVILRQMSHQVNPLSQVGEGKNGAVLNRDLFDPASS